MKDFSELCPECRGTGESYGESTGHINVIICSECGGKGKILTLEGDKIMRAHALFLPDYLKDWVEEIIDKRVRYETYKNEREV